MNIKLRYKFKIDDLVECVERDDYIGVKGHGWKKGLIFKITKILHDCSHGCCFHGQDGGGVYPEYLKPVERNDMMKVGDIIVEKDGDRAEVLAICGKMFCKGFWNNLDVNSDLGVSNSSWYKIDHLKKHGWKIEVPEDPKITAAIKFLKEKGKLVNNRLVN